MIGSGKSAGRRVRAATAVLVVSCVLMAAGCGEDDPGALGPTGVGSASGEARAVAYMDGLDRSLQAFGSAQGPMFTRAVDGGNKRQLQIAALAWDEGVATLKQQDPPKDAIEAHERLIAAGEGLSTWNRRLVAAAPNKVKVKRLARAAAKSPPSRELEASVCQLVELGYEVIDPAQCIADEGLAL